MRGVFASDAKDYDITGAIVVTAMDDIDRMLFCSRVEFWLLTGGRLMGDQGQANG